MKLVPGLVTFFTLPMLAFTAEGASGPEREPLRVVVAGVSHGHVDWILHRERKDIEVVAWQDENLGHLRELGRKHKIPPARLFRDLNAAIRETRPEGVLAFGAVDEHLAVVKAAATAGLPVMVEKPLSHTLEHGQEIARISQTAGIPVWVNYETNWYPSLERVAERLASGELGAIRKLHFRTGHEGPAELGAKPEFLEWLGRPERGGGALLDFGCYGAAIAGQLFRSERPLGVSAVLAHRKPNLYPHGEDEATLLLRYQDKQVLIEASWNWPFGRKEMTVDGTKSALHQSDATHLERVLGPGKAEELPVGLLRQHALYDDAFSFFARAVRKEISVPAHHPATLENALLVMEILSAARKSATSGREVTL